MDRLIKITGTLLLLVAGHTTPVSAQEQDNSGLQWLMEWLYEELEINNNDQPFSPANTDNLLLKVDLARDWKFNIGDNALWATPTYQDQNWENIKVPSRWENEGFNGYDGIAWYRTSFDGRLLNPKQTHYLVLGNIDDADECFFNGRMIGKNGRFAPKFRTAYTTNRRYLIPNESIDFGGENTIAVRVYDEVLDGGIVSGKIGVYADFNSENLVQDLMGQWKFTRWDKKNASDPNYDDSGWDDIWVPSLWDNQGYRSFDGVAWYRRHFELSFIPKENKTYYLLLGKIDDYDITYLNGHRIGVTADGKNFGESQSYDQIRLYKIPKGLLKQDQSNVLSVQVRDLGYYGGIYKGPIGIVEER
ncbi:sialate O-acetylesterase [Reichenbachiella agariperforans]|uniref:Sialate O-acetylesterase n=1 Tax=Reichenbachiella agariperforans TaxID=156994 RepID=A0A1M6WF38_REIAG|nr:beta galactosidase jelly roll domain-containing protein [Reichenbachiella agariperforans]SHK92380.1 sialate O-acetylesterase [Reichenbachiella agariperforans]